MEVGGEKMEVGGEKMEIGGQKPELKCFPNEKKATFSNCHLHIQF
jgi:hypothetical protein